MIRLIIFLFFKRNKFYIFIHPLIGEDKQIIRKLLYKFMLKKSNKTCALIMDLEYTRFKGLSYINYDIQSLKLFDYIIAHNTKMIDLLVENGLDRSKLFNLEMFDNLSNNKIEKQFLYSKTVVFAGNLEKSTFLNDLYKCTNISYKLNLYGVGLTNKKLPSFVKYKGAFTTEEIINVLDGSFGLVWDGTSINTCSGFLGEYTKINNPGKFPLYIAAGLPVIAWKQSALADVVKKYNIGILIDSLNELDFALSTISEENYKTLSNNVLQLRKKVISGYHYKKVLEDVIKRENINA